MSQQTLCTHRRIQCIPNYVCLDCGKHLNIFECRLCKELYYKGPIYTGNVCDNCKYDINKEEGKTNDNGCEPDDPCVFVEYDDISFCMKCGLQGKDMFVKYGYNIRDSSITRKKT